MEGFRPQTVGGKEREGERERGEGVGGVKECTE